jgi:hypothetical protein
MEQIEVNPNELKRKTIEEILGLNELLEPDKAVFNMSLDHNGRMTLRWHGKKNPDREFIIILSPEETGKIEAFFIGEMANILRFLKKFQMDFRGDP